MTVSPTCGRLSAGERAAGGNTIEFFVGRELDIHSISKSTFRVTINVKLNITEQGLIRNDNFLVIGALLGCVPGVACERQSEDSMSHM